MVSLSMLAILLTLGAGSAIAAEESELPGEPLDRIVAVVNDDVILESELDSETREIKILLKDQGKTDLPPDAILRRQVLERTIATTIQKQFAARAGITVSDDRVNQTLQQIAKQNNITLSELPQHMAARGVRYRQFRESIREEILLAEVRNRVIDSKVSVSPREVNDYLQQQEREGSDNRYEISQILVAVPGEARPEEIESARERIVELRKEILSGDMSFADAALRNSDGQRALEGGSLGWRATGQLPTIFVEPVMKLGIGEISEPIRSGSGWHIVRLDDARRENREQVVATETHARHILIKPDQITTPADARELLERIRARIKAGEDFAELAQEFSDDTTASQGGDLGWAPPGRYVPKFEQVMDALPINGLSEPFESQFGWHIIQVLDRRETDFTERVAENQAYGVIRQRKGEEQFPRWLQQQFEDAFIERRLDE